MSVVDASPQSSIRSWTHSDVKSWLKDVGLEDRWVCVSTGPGIVTMVLSKPRYFPSHLDAWIDKDFMRP